MLNQELVREATRLTRAGQLAEATALLQRMLRGESAANASGAGPVARRQLERPIIDVKAEIIGEQTTRRSPTSRNPLPTERAKPFGNIKQPSPLHPVLLKRAPQSRKNIAPEGTRFIEGTFSSTAGSRAFKLFIPSSYEGKALPLIIMLHGCSQCPDDFAAGTRMNFLAEEENCFVAYPEQPSTANQARCWNWFRASDQQRGSGEPSLIAGITRQIMRDYAVDPKRIYVAGLSAGGAAAAIMGASYPDLYAAVGVHSGLICGAAKDLPSAFAAMRAGGSAGSPRPASVMPTIIFHGDRDTTVHPDNGNQIFDQSTSSPGSATKVLQGRVPGGHAYTRTMVSDGRGKLISEHWKVHGAGHAWSGGAPAGSYTDPQGPSASREMLRFFLTHQS